MLKVWGNAVDCCSNQLASTTLNPADFGYETAEELEAAINLIIKKGKTFGGEVIDKENSTGYTVLGKPVYRQAFRVSGFTPGDPFVHGLGIDMYVKVNIFSWENAFPDDKRQTSAKNDVGGQLFYHGTLQPGGIDEIITDAGFDELYLDLEYTKLSD